MISMIKQALLGQFKKLSPLRSIEEGLVSFDFQLKPARESLMQICFSPLAAWFSALLFILLLLSPFRYHFTIVQFLGFDHWIVSALFQSDIRTQLSIFFIFVVLTIVARFDFIALFILGWLLSNGDLHIVLAQAGLIGILFAQVRHQTKWLRKTEGEIRRIINWVYCLQMLCFVIFIFVSWWLLENIRASGLFDQSIRAYRMEYLIFVYLIYQFLTLTVLSLWGHFYFQRKSDPSQWNLKYSAVMIIPQFYLSASFKKTFEAKVHEIFKKRMQQEAELKSDDPMFKVIPHKLREMQKQETEYINLAKKMIE